MRSTTDTLIVAMRVLARDVQSTDGIANSAIAEAADRLEELQNAAALVITMYDEYDLGDEHVFPLRNAVI